MRDQYNLKFLQKKTHTFDNFNGNLLITYFVHHSIPDELFASQDQIMSNMFPPTIKCEHYFTEDPKLPFTPLRKYSFYFVITFWTQPAVPSISMNLL